MLKPFTSCTGFDASDQPIKRVARAEDPTDALNLEQAVELVEAGSVQDHQDNEIEIEVPPSYDYRQGVALLVTVPGQTNNHSLYIGGFRQRSTAYSVSGTVLTLPANLLLEWSDEVTLVYRNG